jgi:dihydroorotase
MNGVLPVLIAAAVSSTSTFLAGRSEQDRVAGIHSRTVFADIHAHPGRFHRANIERIGVDEIARYQRGLIDVVVCNISSDAAYHGGYTARDGSSPKRLQGNDKYPLTPGQAFAFTLDRLAVLEATVAAGDAVLASDPAAVLDAKRKGKLALLFALEGADGLEGRLENLRELHRRGVRLVQLMHFLDNDIGSNQTPPHEARGLTSFGRDLIREANQLGIVVDLAHANTQTIRDALAVSSQPMLFSHTGVKALHKADRYLTDDEIRAIAAKGGVIGIWPAEVFETPAGMVRHIDHVKRLVGIDHVGIGSDLRGMSYLPAFGEEANFRAIVDGLIAAGYSDDEIGKVMGGNFFRVWQQIARAPEFETHDLVIANGRVMDPESGLDATRHIGVTGGTVRALSTTPLKGRTTIDATGLVVSPGFIDLHQHGQTPDDYRRKAADGVTAALELEVGTADIDRWYADRAGKAAIHYGVSVGHIPVRMTVMKDPGDFLPSGAANNREATEQEQEQILTMLARGLEQGAVGMGFGIAYTPQAARWEIAEAFAVAGRVRAPVFVHMRGGDPIGGFEEVLALSVINGAPLHVVHAQSTGGRQTPRLLQLVAAARARNLDVTTEMYPYTASASRIESALYDDWERFTDARFQNLLWPATGERLTRETFAKYRAQGGTVISFGNTEEVVSAAVSHPATMIASDGSPQHPRGAGTFARVLGRYVREQNALTLMDALRKMTIMPAMRLETRVPAMRTKGRVRVGADADLTIFDAGRVLDQATYEVPQRGSAGIVHVLVAGRPVVRDGQVLTDAAAGQPVRAASSPVLSRR